ncbi:alpha/beta fold hydrolase [Paramicrobacterium agarici]|uniref:Pimeloyl-ACP methyl ester carboxylesterase n=1 Tax=Paramicrobacterium agarici TaxID=630514 RepID=A0A2A9DUQ3_9MICO|nr:alpha/beta hydrolase [Microbacterium agarici]PFG30507.1 pimeloyl-ACP methyl ester carboxylesterase [Microbacterium agarici]
MSVLRSGELLIPSSDAHICAEAFGRPEDPAILLIGGAASSMDSWDDDFCDRLAAAQRYVVRYDLRDTGRSTHSPAGKPGYSGSDLASDVLAVLDGFDVRAACLFGVSMGGAIAQVVAAEHPERVSSLVLQSTTPALARGDDALPLPPMDSSLGEYFASEDQPDWSNRDAAIEALVNGERPFAGSAYRDDERQRRIAARSYDRTADMAAMQTNHWLVGGDAVSEKKMTDIVAPTLVFHGTADPLFPYGHGEALAEEIQGAKLVPLPGMGHQFAPEALWDLVIAEVVAHTAG